ncbi:MAG: hypothetical protein EOO50_14020 [Flavobacterium sp.]|uniref:S41 family peptidase n=1 Tax=Flavobacterium sp. TaxID=239 RepID=UPI00120F6304|nr:S41 family peptidase [Flavobacterium sp.]RZJ65366.1 MAG: hypothetical protein EOO50_14020 [Flavobacterium sp.]
MKNQIFSRLPILIGAFLLCTNASAQQPRTFTVSKNMQREVIESLISKLSSDYIFPEVASKMAKEIRAKQKSGAYAKITDSKEFAKMLTDDLQAISHDKHLGVRFSGEMFDGVPTAEREKRQEEIQHHVMKVSNYGFRKVEILYGNIGYLKVDGFAPEDLAGPIANASMAFLANTDALIIDLRENHGGEPDMVRFLASCFFKADVHLNDLYYRKENKTDEFRTKDPAGSRYEKPVYILTSARTFSGGEEFAYDFQTQKRAILIGETTGGGANPGDQVDLKGDFMAFIPNGRAINPITKTNWEGVGVVPDVAMPAADALQYAHEAALRAALEASPEMHKGYYQGNLERLLKK